MNSICYRGSIYLRYAGIPPGSILHDQVDDVTADGQHHKRRVGLLHDLLEENQRHASQLCGHSPRIGRKLLPWRRRRPRCVQVDADVLPVGSHADDRRRRCDARSHQRRHHRPDGRRASWTSSCDDKLRRACCVACSRVIHDVEGRAVTTWRQKYCRRDAGSCGAGVAIWHRLDHPAIRNLQQEHQKERQPG